MAAALSFLSFYSCVMPTEEELAYAAARQDKGKGGGGAVRSVIYGGPQTTIGAGQVRAVPVEEKQTFVA